jgi:lysyl endopeptidase
MSNSQAQYSWHSALVLMSSILCIVLAPPSKAVARQGEPPKSWTETAAALSRVPVMQLPPVDIGEELRKAADEADPGPLQVAVPHEVSISPARDGEWEELPEVGRIWRYRFSAPGATDLNFGFTTFRLPPGATLHVYSETERYYEGPYTSQDNKPHGELWTPMVPGDRAVIELFVPDVVEFAPELELSRVSAGFTDILGRSRKPSLFPKQGACNIDVVCPEAEPWRNEIRSVANLLIGGFGLCTGTLINDVPRSTRPFFLTAAHCGITAQQAPRIVFHWNFEARRCGALAGGSLADNQTGSSFRASRADVDVTLIELDDPPDPSFNVFFSGWDRSGAVPRRSVGIHHPNNDEKAISFNEDRLRTVNNCIGPGVNTHWEVDDWERGTTEPGSSGSGLWDADTKKLVGFLSGGDASCSFPQGSDCYGKFSVAWDGPSPAQRLRDHLDPGNTGALTVGGTNQNVAQIRNDHFADAILLRGRRGSVTGTNVGATSQRGEPVHAGVGGGKSVWWRWRARRTERAEFSTAGSDFDTVLAVYRGHRLARLRELASNDDDVRLGLQSRVRLRVVTGRLYRIAVDGYEGDAGNIVLNFRPLASGRSTAAAAVSERHHQVPGKASKPPSEVILSP